jgi:hypothetical protein
LFDCLFVLKLLFFFCVEKSLTFEKSNPKRERGNTIDCWEQLVDLRKHKEISNVISKLFTFTPNIFVHTSLSSSDVTFFSSHTPLVRVFVLFCLICSD